MWFRVQDLLLLTTPVEMCRWLKLCKRKHVRRHDNEKTTSFALQSLQCHGFHALKALFVT